MTLMLLSVCHVKIIDFWWLGFTLGLFSRGRTPFSIRRPRATGLKLTGAWSWAGLFGCGCGPSPWRQNLDTLGAALEAGSTVRKVKGQSNIILKDSPHQVV